MDIDTQSIPEILKIINDEDKRVAAAVENEIGLHCRRQLNWWSTPLKRGKIDLCWSRNKRETGSS